MLSLSFERNCQQKGVGAAEQPSGGSNRTIRRFAGSKARRPSSSQTHSAGMQMQLKFKAKATKKLANKKANYNFLNIKVVVIFSKRTSKKCS